MIKSFIRRDDIHAKAQHHRPSILRPDFSKNDFYFQYYFPYQTFCSSRWWKFFRSKPFIFWYNTIKSEDDVRSIFCFNVFATLICSTVKFEKYDLILLGSGFQIYVLYICIIYWLLTFLCIYGEFKDANVHTMLVIHKNI